MFVAHFGVGFGSKLIAERVSLGTLFLAAQFVDLLWPALLLLGVEVVEIMPGATVMTPLEFVSYPISHSLLMVFVWGVLFGLIHWLLKRNMNAALVLGFCVVSHWVLDFIVHQPDLPLLPGDSPLVGLSLWNSMGGTLFIEAALYLSGIAFYLKSTKAVNRTGKYGFWALVVFLGTVYLLSIFGPPPPNTTAIAWAGHLQWLFVVWGYWVDKNRAVRSTI